VEVSHVSDDNFDKGGDEGPGRDGEPEPEQEGGGREEFEPDWDEYFNLGEDPPPGAGEPPPRRRRRVNSEQEQIYRREGAAFRRLARELSLKVSEMDHHFRFNGLLAADLFFCLLMRTYYHNLSARRLHYELRVAQREGLITRVPSPNTVLYHLRHELLTPLLRQIIPITALPFWGWDRRFAVDSTRIRTVLHLIGADRKVVMWGDKPLYKLIKLHLASGLSSLSVVSARVTGWTVPDVLYLRPLLEDASRSGFVIHSVTADRGYVSKENHQYIDDLGAKAYITFKQNNRKSKNGSDPVWDANLERFRTMKGEELTPYHERTLIEAVNWMIKSRFGRSARGITETAQFNEALLKAICHNLTRLNQYSLGLDDEYVPVRKS
jgi:hypothetical protein